MLTPFFIVCALQAPDAFSEDTPSGYKWVTIDDTIIFFTCQNFKMVSASTKLAPWANPSDGFLDVCFLRGHPPAKGSSGGGALGSAGHHGPVPLSPFSLSLESRSAHPPPHSPLRSVVLRMA